MIHTKFLGNRPTSSGEEDFWRVFTIYGHGGHLGHVTQMPRINFRSSYPWRFHTKFGFDWPSGFGEEDVWNCGWTDNGRRTDSGAWVYYKLTWWAFGSGELKKLQEIVAQCMQSRKKLTTKSDKSSHLSPEQIEMKWACTPEIGFKPGEVEHWKADISNIAVSHSIFEK